MSHILEGSFSKRIKPSFIEKGCQVSLITINPIERGRISKPYIKISNPVKIASNALHHLPERFYLYCFRSRKCFKYIIDAVVVGGKGIGEKDIPVFIDRYAQEVLTPN